MASATDRSRSAPGSVVVIDDDSAALESFGALLESDGLSPLLYASCEQFLAGERPSGLACLLLDARFPQMSGLELLDVLHREGRALPTVFVMGRFDGSARARALRFPSVVEVLYKPVGATELFGAIRQALKR
jgi:FixJ family two-component response regulator